MAKNIIAFMGVAGANADLACRQAFPYMETLPCASFDDVFVAVEKGKAELGIIPIENSQAGRVAEIHNILPHAKLHIVGEVFKAATGDRDRVGSAYFHIHASPLGRWGQPLAGSTS